MNYMYLDIIHSKKMILYAKEYKILCAFRRNQVNIFEGLNFC